MTDFVFMADPTALPTVEMVYPLASPEGHQTVRTAVLAALTRLRPLSPIPAAETTDGVTVYYLSFCNIYVQLLIVQISERLANLQITIVGKLVNPRTLQMADESLLTPTIMKEITVVLQTVDRFVQDSLRKTYVLDELKPPAPPLDDLQALFYYQRIYFPHLDDVKFSEHIKVPIQTLRNWRNASGMTQRNFRPTAIDWSEVRPNMDGSTIPRWAKEDPQRRRKPRR
jgi:hypothetical protein